MTQRNEASVPFNFAMDLLLRLSGTVCGAISYPFAFRMIGEAGMGRAVFAASAGSFFLMLAGMGVSTYGVRECARVRDDPAALRRTARELLSLQLIMTLLSAVLMCAAVIAVPRLWENRLLFLIQGGLLLFHALDTQWLFAAEERYAFLTVRSFTMRLATVALILLFVRKPEDYLLYALITSVTVVLGYLWNLLGAGSLLRGPREKLQPLRHFRPSAVFFLQAAAVTVYTGLDSVLLGFLKDDAAVGAYDAAAKIRAVLVMFIASLCSVLLPRFSYYLSTKQEERFRQAIVRSASLVFLITLPLTAYFLLMGESCLTVLYGGVAEDTLWSLRLLLPTVFLVGCSNTTGLQLLTPMGRERTVMVSTVVGAAVDLIADLLLIPYMGAPGAALGTVIAEAAVLAVQAAAVRRLGIRLAEGKSALRIAGVTLAASVELLLLRLVPLTELGRVLLGAVLFFGTVYGVLLALKDPALTEMAAALRGYLRGSSDETGAGI